MLQVKVFWAETRLELEKKVNKFCATANVKDISYSVCPRELGYYTFNDIVYSYHCMVLYEV